jgi:hypothetical protein
MPPLLPLAQAAARDGKAAQEFAGFAVVNLGAGRKVA